MSGIRQGRLRDAEAIGRIEVETWRSTYPGMLADRVLLDMSPTRRAAFWAHLLRACPGEVWVWEDDRTGLQGFGHCSRERDSYGYDGEITMLYVLPDAQGEGIGRELLLTLLARLADLGCASAIVWVLRDNPARFFYEHLGAKLVLQRRIPVGGQAVETLGYGWKRLTALLDQRAR
jgi:GNAT superfamily N-acetyltransferase